MTSHDNSTLLRDADKDFVIKEDAISKNHKEVITTDSKITFIPIKNIPKDEFQAEKNKEKFIEIADDDLDELINPDLREDEEIEVDDETYEKIEHRVSLGEELDESPVDLFVPERKEVEDAVHYGLKKMHELVLVKEPELYRKGTKQTF